MQSIPAGRFAGGTVDPDTAWLDEEAAQETLLLTNEARSALGVGALTVDAALMDLARQRARELVFNYSHDQATTAEIIQTWYGLTRTPVEMVDGWIGSPPHYANLSDSKWTRMGAAVIRVPDLEFKGYSGFTFAIQVFGQ